MTSLVSRTNSAMLKAREILDELEGITRLEKGKNTLVFDDAGKLSTGYEGAKSVVNTGYRITGEKASNSAKAWQWRDDLQQRLVRQARRLPYEVPAFYAADKYITKPLFGGANEETAGPKKKWYDPSRGIDIAKELAVTSLFQMGGFMLPTAALGASKESSLNFYRTAQQRLTSANATGYADLTKGMTKHSIYEKSLNLQGILQEVGQDLFSVLDKSIKFSERSSGALSSAFTAMSDIHKNPVAALYSQRHGVNPVSGTPKPPRKQTIQNLARDIYKGDKTKLNQVGAGGRVQGTQIDSMLDLIPGYKAVRQGAKSAQNEYKKLSLAQSFLDNPGQNWSQITKGFGKIIGVSEASADGARQINDMFSESILNIQRKRSSDLFSLLGEFGTKTGGFDKYTRTERPSIDFVKRLRQDVYKSRLEQRLIDDGLSEAVAKQFTKNLTVKDDPYRLIVIRGKKSVKEVISPTVRLAMGQEEIVGEDFFGQLIARFNSGKMRNK